MDGKERSWHSLPLREIKSELDTDFENGLTEKEAKNRHRLFGLNRLMEEKPVSSLMIFLRQFQSPLIYILAAAGGITLFLKDFTDALVIFGAVFINTFIGFLQEKKTSNVLSELKKIIRERAHVIREGNEKEIDAGNLAPGDIFILEAGSRVPCDGRLIQSRGLKINEAALTGEWLPKDAAPGDLAEDALLADRDNMVYMGTAVEEGRGRAVVVSTGAKTEIGKIAEMLKETKEEKTPYQKKLSRFSKIIGIIVVAICLIILTEGLIVGEDFLEMFITSIAVAVAAIPEGLPVAITIILALGMGKILKRKGLVRKLSSAETLGSTDIILTDKTGTLTEGKMQVAGVFTPRQMLYADAEQMGAEDGSHISALKIALLCSNAYIENPEDELHQWIVRGRPMERAFLMAGVQAGISKKELERDYPRHDELSFDPVYKYSAALHHLNETEDMIYAVGAPEKIMAMSSFVDGVQEELNKESREKLNHKLDELTGKALRIVAVGYKKTGKDGLRRNLKEKLNGIPPKEIKNHHLKLYENDLKGLIFAGFIALKDPLRKEVKGAIHLCREAGIRPIIVTGDHKLTARAVARELGFKTEERNIIEGKELMELSDGEFKKRLDDFEIYARVEPAQKLRIVKAWQERGMVTAMTGDGVNDAPALKQADIGIALGSGTEVAKEASDLVLLDDNFSIIVAAIEEGRAILDNMRKVITFVLCGSFTEIILVSSSVIFGWPLPVLAAQILWINIVEDGLPSTALAFEPKEKDLMAIKPQNHTAPLLNKEMKILIFIIGIFTDILLLGLFYWFLKYSGYGISHIRSVIFAGLAIDSLFYIFSCKSLRKNLWQINPFSNKFILFAWSFGIILLLAALYFPPLRTILRTESLNIFDWILLFGLGMINLILIEAVKHYFISRDKIK